MSSQLTIEGVEYISSKRAAEITGYSQDYVGQLARAGKILGKRVGGLWYIVSDSLSGYKQIADAYTPTPPAEVPKTSEDSSAVTLEGKTYVSAARASKLTSYHQDYIGQLARGGKILSKQIGKRWYIDVEALKAHKKEKDSLLGAVQASSVGLERSAPGVNNQEMNLNDSDPYDVGLHYTYKAEVNPLIPVIVEKSRAEALSKEFSALDEEHHIPIRIMRPAITPHQPPSITEYHERKKAGRTPVLSIFIKIFPIIAIAALSVVVYNFSPSVSMPALKIPRFDMTSVTSMPSFASLSSLAESLFSREIRYTRE